MSREELAVKVVAATPEATKWLRENCEFKVLEQFDGDRVLRKRAVQLGANVGAVINESDYSVMTESHSYSGTMHFVHYSRTDWSASKSLLYSCDPGRGGPF